MAKTSMVAAAAATGLGAVLLLAVFQVASVEAGRTLIVGDSFGWNLPPNQTFYQEWTLKNKPWYNDTLVFNYKGDFTHNLFISNSSNPWSLFCRIVGDPAKGTFLPNAEGPAGFQYNLTIPGPGYYAISDPTVLETGNPLNRKNCARGMRLLFVVVLSPPPPGEVLPPPPPPNSGGLSGGQIAGIVIGCTAAAILLLAGIGYALSRKAPPPEAAAATNYVEPKPDTAGTSYAVAAPPPATTVAPPPTVPPPVTYAAPSTVPAAGVGAGAAATTYSLPTDPSPAPTTVYTAPATGVVPATTYVAPEVVKDTLPLPTV